MALVGSWAIRSFIEFDILGLYDPPTRMGDLLNFFLLLWSKYFQQQKLDIAKVFPDGSLSANRILGMGKDLK